MMRKKKTARMRRKTRSLRPLLYAVIGTVVLGLLLLGAGVAYVYFSGSDEELSDPQSADSQVQNEPSFEAREPDPDASVGVSTQMITTPVAPGSNATFEIRTLRGAECDITVEYDDVESQDSGLTSREADRFGIASWTWSIEETVPEGEWPVEVTCNRNENSGMLREHIHVTYDLDDSD